MSETVSLPLLHPILSQFLISNFTIASLFCSLGCGLSHCQERSSCSLVHDEKLSLESFGLSRSRSLLPGKARRHHTFSLSFRLIRLETSLNNNVRCRRYHYHHPHLQLSPAQPRHLHLSPRLVPRPVLRPHPPRRPACRHHRRRPPLPPLRHPQVHHQHHLLHSLLQRRQAPLLPRYLQARAGAVRASRAALVRLALSQLRRLLARQHLRLRVRVRV